MWYMSPASVLCALVWKLLYYQNRKFFVVIMGRKNVIPQTSSFPHPLLLFKNYFDNKHCLLKDLAGRCPSVWFLNEVFFMQPDAAVGAPGCILIVPF